jgi:hypothetical protein
MADVLPDVEMPRVPGLLGAIFEEAGRGDRQAREALFLSFNVDLGFFESRLLGPVRSAGAAVTVLGDSTVFQPDPRSVRSAGHSYTFGLAAMAGAFHPKLTVLVGPERALVGIGSGNLTVGGWHANDEVITVITADRTVGSPAILRDVARFLTLLPEIIRISPLAAEGVIRTATQLNALVESSPQLDTGHQLLHTLETSILEQLPTERVDRLELSAPFHDLHGAALRGLMRRLQPSLVTILTQPGQAVMDPQALMRAAEELHTRLDFVGTTQRDSPYRHGKLVTAFLGPEPVWTLIGSPNLSAAALLGTAPTRNCEIAVLHLPGRALLPTFTESITDVAPLLHTQAPEPAGDITEGAEFPPRLLEARAIPEGVRVTFSQPLESDGDVYVSDYVWPPERFDVLGRVTAGLTHTTFPGQFSPGTRLRFADQIQFLAFPDAVVSRLRPSGGGHANRDLAPAELFASDTLAAEWSKALATLMLSHGSASSVAGARSSTEPSSEPGHANWHTLDTPDAWSAYADDALLRLGLPIFQLAAGAANERSVVGAGLPNVAPAWEDHFDEAAEAFEEGRQAEDVEGLEEPPKIATPASLSAARRSRLRNWVRGLGTLAPQLPPLELIAVTQLITAGTSAQIWDEARGASGWFDPLAETLQTFPSDHWPAAARRQAAGVAAVALYRLRMALPVDERGPEGRRFRALGQQLGTLLEAADVDSVAANLNMLSDALLVPRSAQDVLSELADALRAEPREILLRVLSQLLPEAEIGWRSRQHVVLSGQMTNPMATASLVLQHADQLPNLAVSVHGANERFATVVRTPNRLLVVQTVGRHLTYQTFDTSGLLHPAGLITNKEMAQARRLSSPPLNQASNVDLQVLAAVGLQIEDCAAQ